MSRIALVGQLPAPLVSPARPRAESPPREAEHAEEVWDAEL